MEPKQKHLKTRLYIVAALILLVGLGSSMFIYLKAGNDPGGALGYDIVGGDVYPIMPGDSKIYRHDLEVYGGKANVLMDKFMRWFEGLWHGKSLAFTIASFTVIISIGLFYIAYHWPSDVDTDTRMTK